MPRLVPIVLLSLPMLASAQSFADFLRQVFEEHLRDNPEFATSVGRHEYDDRWTDWSKAGRQQRRQHLQQRLEKLAVFPPASLSRQDRLSARLMDYDLRRRLEAFDLESELFAVMQQNGLHNAIYSTIDRMPARTVHDYQNLAARLAAVPV